MLPLIENVLRVSVNEFSFLHDKGSYDKGTYIILMLAIRPANHYPSHDHLWNNSDIIKGYKST